MRARHRDVSQASVELAELNLKANAVTNVDVARLSAEEFVEAFNGSKTFKRLTEKGIHLGESGDAGYRLETLFVDPPRAGLDATCRELAAGFERVLYVSCNPETLARDVAELAPTHEITALAAFDQFPYTPHLEAGVLLERRARGFDGDTRAIRSSKGEDDDDDAANNNGNPGVMLTSPPPWAVG
jgi:tRNA (uracil-5-)-methyltransferase